MKVFYGVHFYININNLNSIIKDDEGDHENLNRTFHALNTFVTSMERYASEFSDVQVEKYTASRLHFYIPIDGNRDTVITEMLELIAYSSILVELINQHSKYKSLINFKIGAGVDYGKYTEFTFVDKDSGFEEMTTIGSPANRAAKLQSLCENGKVLVSKEVYEMLPLSIKRMFFGKSEATLILVKKYHDLFAHEAEIDEVDTCLGDDYNNRKEKYLDDARDIIGNLNINEIEISDTYNKLSFSNLSVKNSKHISEAVILFSDIRGFTKKVDESNLAEMKQLTQTVLTMMNKTVLGRDGVHVQFQGDRESAVFNHYSKEADDYVLRAVLCAMCMLDKLDELNQKREDKLNIGIGCSMGDVFATRIGKRLEKFNVILGQTVKEADDAEDNVAGIGANGKNNQSEIAITSEMYNYLVGLPNKDSKYIKKIFSSRRMDDKTYYITTTRLSAYQKMLEESLLQENALRAQSEQRLKPWGCKK